MNIKPHVQKLLVSGTEEISAVNANKLLRRIKAALRPNHRCLDIDLSATRFIDSTGLGILVGLHQFMQERNGKMRLLSPCRQVQQLIEFTRLNRFFEVAST